MNTSSIFLLLMSSYVALAFPKIEQNAKIEVPGRCTVSNFACPLNDTLIKFDDTQTKEGCRQRCRENDECNWWTHFNSDNADNKTNQCLLFNKCEVHDNQICNPVYSCFSGDGGCDYGDGNVPVVLGGINRNGTNVTRVEAFVEDNHDCNVIPEIPNDMAYKNRATAVFDANIYGCGGEGTNDVNPTKQCMVLDVLNKFDYHWKSSEEFISPMLDARTSAAAVGAYGELYVFGGSNSTPPNLSLMSSVLIYNPESKEWRYLDSEMEHARAGHCAILKKDLVFLLGGKTAGCGCDKDMSFDTYNITSKEWKTYSLDGTEQRMGHACVLYKDQIIVSGGASGTDWTNLRDDVIAIDIIPGENFAQISSLPSLNTPRMSHGMTIYMDSPYVMGGHSTNDDYIKDNEILNGNSTKWDFNETLFTTRSHFSVTELSTEIIAADNLRGCP